MRISVHVMWSVFCSGLN